MKINPYLFFNGNCREAFEFYANSLGVDIQAMMSSSDMPADAGQSGCVGEAPADKIMHACIDLGGSCLMASDWMSPEPFAPVKGSSVALAVDSVAEAERVFAALSDGGQVTMALEKTFFAAAFGMLTDKFGVPWMVNCDQPG